MPPPAATAFVHPPPGGWGGWKGGGARRSRGAVSDGWLAIRRRRRFRPLHTPASCTAHVSPHRVPHALCAPLAGARMPRRAKVFYGALIFAAERGVWTVCTTTTLRSPRTHNGYSPLLVAETTTFPRSTHDGDAPPPPRGGEGARSSRRAAPPAVPTAPPRRQVSDDFPAGAYLRPTHDHYGLELSPFGAYV